MIANLKCSVHPNKSAIYICTFPQCSENCLCNTCAPTHNVNHLKRYLVLNETFTDENSLFNIVKSKQSKKLSELTLMIKENESFIAKKIKHIESCFKIINKETVDIIGEFKRKVIEDYKNSWNKEKNINTVRINEIYENIIQVKMEEEDDVNVIVKKIQFLEDDLLPSSTKELKKINIQSNELYETFHINPNYCEVFSKHLINMLNETDFFMKQSLEKLCKISFNSSLSLDVSIKELIISSPTKIEADTLNKFGKIIIEDGGILSINPWDGNKGGRLILMCNSLIIKPNGIIDVSGIGYLGGVPCDNTCPNQADSGESYQGKGRKSTEPNYGGGGGGQQDGAYGGIGGGGGGYGIRGENSEPNTYQKGHREGGKGGNIYGDEEMKTIYMGSGGGAGAPFNNGGEKAHGGNGGGVVVIVASEFNNEGKIISDGGNGEDANENTQGSGGGGGSGGSVFVVYSSLICKGEISVNGGKGGQWGKYFTQPGVGCRGGKGGLGRIMIESFEKVDKLKIFGLKV